MTQLFNAKLIGREFSTHFFHVGDLLEWANSKRLRLHGAETKKPHSCEAGLS